MLQSFLVYNITAILLFVFGSAAAKRERINNVIGEQTAFWTWEVVFSLLIFAFVSGVRWNVGRDHLLYLASYEDIKAGGVFRTRSIEVGFDLITRLFASLDVHFTIYFAFWAFLQLFFMYYAFKNERYLLPFIGLVLVLGPGYACWMNEMRQALAACMFVFSVQYIAKKKNLKYLIIIGLASLIHTTAILLFVFFFIPQKDYFRNRALTFSLLTLSVIIGSTSIWQNFIDGFAVLFDFLSYDVYAKRLDFLVEQVDILNFGPRRIILFLIISFIIWHSKKMKECFKHTNFLMFYNGSLVGEMFFNVFAGAHHVFRRPATYLSIFTIITSAYLLYYLKTSSRRGSFIKLLIFIGLHVFWLSVTIYAGYIHADGDYANFKFFWNYI